MIEYIDLELCDGCNDCIDSCPDDVIVLKEMEAGLQVGPPGWKAVIEYPNDCVSCRLCAIDCHVDAIRVTHGMHIPDAYLSYENLNPKS